MLNIDIRIQFQVQIRYKRSLLGMLNIDIRIQYTSTFVTFTSLLGMLNIDIRILEMQYANH